MNTLLIIFIVYCCISYLLGGIIVGHLNTIEPVTGLGRYFCAIIICVLMPITIIALIYYVKR